MAQDVIPGLIERRYWKLKIRYQWVIGIDTSGSRVIFHPSCFTALLDQWKGIIWIACSVHNIILFSWLSPH